MCSLSVIWGSYSPTYWRRLNTAAAKQQLFPYDMSFLRPTTSQCSNHTSCTAVTRFHKASNPQTSAALRAKLKLRNMLLGVVMFELISTHMLRQVGEQNKRFVFSFFTVVVLVIWYNLRFYSLFWHKHSLRRFHLIWQIVGGCSSICGYLLYYVINRIQILHFALTNVGVSNLFSLMQLEKDSRLFFFEVLCIEDN